MLNFNSNLPGCDWKWISWPGSRSGGEWPIPARAVHSDPDRILVISLLTPNGCNGISQNPGQDWFDICFKGWFCHFWRRKSCRNSWQSGKFKCIHLWQFQGFFPVCLVVVLCVLCPFQMFWSAGVVLSCLVLPSCFCHLLILLLNCCHVALLFNDNCCYLLYSLHWLGWSSWVGWVASS